MGRMTLLGVGTGVPDVDRDYTHMVWEGAAGPVLIDAGGSTYQRLLRAGVDPQQLQGVILTHSHTDHIHGLFALVFSMYLAGRRETLPVYGLEPTLAVVQRILDAFQLEQYATPLEWYPLQAGDVLPVPGDPDGIIRTAAGTHSRPCLALRFESRRQGRALTYSADTAPCQQIIDLARGSAILIHEATTGEPFPGHTTPRQAGEVAAAAQVEHLVLVHFSPRWTMSETEALAAVRAGGFAGRVEVGREYQVLELEQAEPA